MKTTFTSSVIFLLFSQVNSYSQTSYLGSDYGVGKWNYDKDNVTIIDSGYINKFLVNALSSYYDIGIRYTIEPDSLIFIFDAKLNHKHRANKEFSLNYIQLSAGTRMVLGKKFTVSLGIGPMLLLLISDKGSVNYFYDDNKKKIMFGYYFTGGFGYNVSNQNKIDLIIINQFDLSPMFHIPWNHGSKEAQYASSIGLELKLTHKISLRK